MSDIEKNTGGMTSAGNTLTTINGAHAAQFPLGPDPGGVYPYTLGASAAQQQLYQGVTGLRKFANPALL